MVLAMPVVLSDPFPNHFGLLVDILTNTVRDMGMFGSEILSGSGHARRCMPSTFSP